MNNPKIYHYLSDLHVDFYEDKFNWKDMTSNYRITDIEKSDTVIIAGDISNDVKQTAAFLKDTKKFYKNVLFVDGNHDHYNVGKDVSKRTTIEENMAYLYAESKKAGWTYLSFEDFIDGDTVIIGNSGWYDLNAGDIRYTKDDYIWAWKNYIADYRLIKFDKMPDVYAAEAALQLAEKVKKYNKDTTIENIVVVTHTLPVHSALVVKDEVNSNDVAWNMLNGCFYNSEMKKVIDSDAWLKIKAWIFGHTHFSKEIQEGHILFLCNPRGYPMEHSNYHFSIKTLTLG